MKNTQPMAADGCRRCCSTCETTTYTSRPVTVNSPCSDSQCEGVREGSTCGRAKGGAFQSWHQARICWRPAVAEHHRLSCAPVLVIDLRTVFRRNRAHCLLPFYRLCQC